MLTHGNLIANSAGCCRFVNFAPDDVHISYLPLAHIYERINTVTCTHRGAAIGFFSGDVIRLLDDIATLRPTIFCSVPRLWNRIFDKARPAPCGHARMRGCPLHTSVLSSGRCDTVSGARRV